MVTRIGRSACASRTSIAPRPLARALGLRVTERAGKALTSWHCDADHHGVALSSYARSGN